MTKPGDAAMPLLAVTGISKRFGVVQALDTMNFDLKRGEVHVIFGENGAGKSTLINVIAGAIQPDQGSLAIDGKDVRFRDVQDARRHGVAAMFQEFSLAPHLSVEENIFLGAEPNNRGFLKIAERRARVRDALTRFGFSIEPKAMVARLSRAEQQMVEMTKALLTDPQVLILDEPTASLSQKETESMFGLVRQLCAQGVGIIYITHRMKEIEAIGDRVTIMRDGRFVKTVDVATTTQRSLVELMTGRSFEKFYPEIAHVPGDVALEVKNLTTMNGCVSNVSFAVRSGEILGLAGLVGCGKSEMIRSIFGLEPVRSGTVEVNGKSVPVRSPARLLEMGVAYIPSDRRNEGLMLLRPTRENLTLSSLGQAELSRSGWLKTANERSFATRLGERLRVRPLELDKPVVKYSGGNQQKIMIAKAMGRETRVFLFDEPTVGIDVSARVEVYGFIKDLVEAGAAVIIVSSDLPEVVNLSHRLLVVRSGEVVDQIDKAEISEGRVLHGFFGTTNEASSH
ncbi:sugar ABC transporter ATP-binding protein [Mesorhizobium sp. CU2]|uniref:sugar ABC transporter ATP-binding protein n=1 Tax=unclassified Mesorhizobium TaxID=325217 RepID=UPI00112D90AE|nr:MULTISPECIES: sugar ABC transporter ATP-binding protein [unclassified Mesorhizobium]TPN85653.1 sugar ABC transporter ATP-binding protein [Mesorhizobium sp. CU3]TPO11010.1 sugar ABC transporter ATP-binding protein [Mesorhizobium sp. CU2]